MTPETLYAGLVMEEGEFVNPTMVCIPANYFIRCIEGPKIFEFNILSDPTSWGTL